MSFMRSSLWMAVLALGTVVAPASAQTLADFTDPAATARLASEFDVRNADHLPARGAKAALVSCIVYTNDRDHALWVTSAGRSILADSLCPSFVRAIHTQLPFEWTPDSVVFANPEVRKRSGQDDTWAGYGDFGAVSRDNGGGGNNVFGALKWGSKKRNTKMPANSASMRKLAQHMGADMVFVAAVLVTPGRKDTWEVNSIELGGYGAQQPAAHISVKIGRGPWTEADVGIRLKKDLDFTWSKDALHVDGFGNIADALTRHLLDRAVAGEN